MEKTARLKGSHFSRHSKSPILHLSWHSSTPPWLGSTFLDMYDLCSTLLTGLDCLGINIIKVWFMPYIRSSSNIWVAAANSK